MVEGPLKGSGCTVCMHRWILCLGFFPELKGTKSKCTEGKQWAVGVVEGGWLTGLHCMKEERAVRAEKH